MPPHPVSRSTPPLLRSVRRLLSRWRCRPHTKDRNRSKAKLHGLPVFTCSTASHTRTAVSAGILLSELRPRIPRQLRQYKTSPGSYSELSYIWCWRSIQSPFLGLRHVEREQHFHTDHSLALRTGVHRQVQLFSMEKITGHRLT